MLGAQPRDDHHVRIGLDAALPGLADDPHRGHGAVAAGQRRRGGGRGGMNALRGHSNIQGLTDLGLLTNLLPGYLTLPSEKEGEYKAYIEKRTPKPLRPHQFNYWSNYPKFHVSLMKAWWGNAATKD